MAKRREVYLESYHLQLSKRSIWNRDGQNTSIMANRYSFDFIWLTTISEIDMTDNDISTKNANSTRNSLCKRLGFFLQNWWGLQQHFSEIDSLNILNKTCLCKMRHIICKVFSTAEQTENRSFIYLFTIWTLLNHIKTLTSSSVSLHTSDLQASQIWPTDLWTREARIPI